ncbi:MAG: hypothetical protein JJU36_10260 [Phycisphaeraceae bacterium]|nr:hypothetical protein [Phycisphaeraceae bacterium]
MLRHVLALTVAMAYWLIPVAFAADDAEVPPEIVFPPDRRAVIDVQRDFGARGDGIADDTEALQRAIEASRGRDHSRFIYLPEGTYRITRTLVFKPPGDGQEGSMVGPWLFGQHRDRTIIRLDDRAQGFGDPDSPREAFRGVSRPDGSRMNADFFDRTIVNLTIDTGDNPGAVGIKFYSNNTGLMQHVMIRGNGECGLDMGFNDQNGPLLIQDVEIDGFATGIRTSHILNSQTLSRVTIRNAGRVGVDHRGQVLAAEKLRVIGSPMAIESGHNGVLTLIDCVLDADGAQGAAESAAIRLGRGHIYAAQLTTRGYRRAIDAANAPAGHTDGPDIAEYISHNAHTLGAGAPSRGLGLRAPDEPVIALPTRAQDWVCANDFGAVPGNGQDDAPAIQRAIDAAAERGAQAVYLLGGPRGDPNWYHLRQNVRIHGSVRLIMGFGQVRILGGGSDSPEFPENISRFVIDEDPEGAPLVALLHLHVFSIVPTFGIEARCPKRTVVCRTIGGATIIARPGTTVFMTNCVGYAYQEPGSTLWMRQWNTEAGPREVGINTRNDGGTLWILGMKTEATSTKLATLRGGRSEVLGVHNYNTRGVRDQTPFFTVNDATFSVAGYREVCFSGAWWPVTVEATLNGEQHRQPPRQWQTWSLLRAGDDPSPAQGP